MPPAKWPLRKLRPIIAVTLPQITGRRVYRLLADTGAGSDQADFELLVPETVCQRAAGSVMGSVSLVGAYSGWFTVYMLDVRIPRLKFATSVPVVGVSKIPDGFDGIACFKFLNRFHYGNFGDAEGFALVRP